MPKFKLPRGASSLIPRAASALITTVERDKTQTMENGELQAILSQQQMENVGICLLRDSPFRILRVSENYIK